MTIAMSIYHGASLGKMLPRSSRHWSGTTAVAVPANGNKGSYCVSEAKAFSKHAESADEAEHLEAQPRRYHKEFV